MESIEARNQMSHSYDNDTVNKIFENAMIKNSGAASDLFDK
jgi:hypothetical protein